MLEEEGAQERVVIFPEPRPGENTDHLPSASGTAQALLLRIPVPALAQSQWFQKLAAPFPQLIFCLYSSHTQVIQDLNRFLETLRPSLK